MAQLVIRLTSKKSIEKAVKTLNKDNERINEIAFREDNEKKSKDKQKEANLTIEI